MHVELFSCKMEEEEEEEEGRSAPTCSSRSHARQYSRCCTTTTAPTSGNESRNKNPRILRHRPVLSYHLLFFTFLICCVPLCSASPYIEEQLVETTDDVPETPGLTLDRLAKSGVILVDQAAPPNGLHWTLATVQDDLKRRDDPFGNAATASSSAASAKSTAKHTSSSSVAPTATPSGIATATSSMSSLPSPFDSGFSANISATCNSFMTGMLGNSSFQQCLPFSLLLQNSVSFFQAEKSLVKITQVLDATCAANVTTCTTLMTSFASNITQTAACASDFSSQNPLIQQARQGLLAYKPIYQASCLKDASTNAYCFANAITNASSPSDNYIYYLPLNISLPGGSLPTCNSCLQNTMAVFEAASADRGSALASDYVDAAMQVNVNCGPNFVNTSLASPVKAGAPSSAYLHSNTGLLALVLVLASWLM
ncbi:hypothetical protein LSUE1_G006993 [Lachnellula suecica]|uniref:DUF7729 domain-containing protein n=1 Tax=Lachnellula suecica TaxID=602035 RepID=A0A8T9C884_9HELO|nr:hypothetical protein LSUE1_G006993 [Lachnellula suecica]